jgi:hypothetical protein
MLNKDLTSTIAKARPGGIIVAAKENVRQDLRKAYVLGIIGIIVHHTHGRSHRVLENEIKNLQQYGYLGLFSSASWGRPLSYPCRCGRNLRPGGRHADALAGSRYCRPGRNTSGALSIYMTGHGAGKALSNTRHSRLQKFYDKLLDLIQRRGTLTLFAVTAVTNPFIYPAAFACGALQFGLRKYILIVFTGKVIKCMTIVYAGYFGLKGLFHLIGLNL